MESQRASFGAIVVDVLRMNAVASHAGDRDDMTMVLLDHCWEEFFDKHEMRNCIDVEN